jgi:hypothetical protein
MKAVEDVVTVYFDETDNSVLFASAASPIDLDPNATSGFSLQFCHVGWFITDDDVGFRVTLSADNAVVCSIAYIKVDN